MEELRKEFVLAAKECSNFSSLIECEYNVSNRKYITNSIFGVPHKHFKIGDKIKIFYDIDNPEKYFCDIKKHGVSEHLLDASAGKDG